jgi:hypothetical protein
VCSCSRSWELTWSGVLRSTHIMLYFTLTFRTSLPAQRRLGPVPFFPLPIHYTCHSICLNRPYLAKQSTLHFSLTRCYIVSRAQGIVSLDTIETASHAPDATDMQNALSRLAKWPATSDLSPVACAEGSRTLDSPASRVAYGFPAHK